jgi:hypothetical protein
VLVRDCYLSPTWCHSPNSGHTLSRFSVPLLHNPEFRPAVKEGEGSSFWNGSLGVREFHRDRSRGGPLSHVTSRNAPAVTASMSSDAEVVIVWLAAQFHFFRKT